MLQLIKDWINAYNPLSKFIGHKLTHIVVGLLITYSTITILSIYVSLAIVALIAVGKEIADRLKSKDYPPPLSYHVLDVIVTFMGGVLGVVIGDYTLALSFNHRLIIGLIMVMVLFVGLRLANETVKK